MAGRNNNTWEAFREKMKDKRCKKARSTGNVNKGVSQGSQILLNKELVVQRLTAEVSGKAQKYNRIGAREFVPFDEEDVSIVSIKAACERHYKSLSEEGLVCDVLAGDQGPSCSSIEHIPNLKVIHVRFIKPTNTPTSFLPPAFSQSNLRENSICGTKSEFVRVNESSVKRKIASERCSSSPAKKPVPKSLTVSQMMKLGKLIDPSESKKSQTMVIEVFNFDFSSFTWSMLPQITEFIVENQPLGEGGFRKAYKAKSCSSGFVGKEWVIKRYLENVVKEVTNDLGQSMEDQTKKVIQMHHLSKNFADQLSKVVNQKKISDKFGPVLQFQVVYFGKIQATGECVTIEQFIKGDFAKYINNTGEICVSTDNLIGQKAECLVHFSYETSNHQLMVLDLQGSGHILYDPEIASVKNVDESKEFLFCAGNLGGEAIEAFVDTHKCNKFCHLLGLNSLA